MTSGREKLYRALESNLALKLSGISDTDFKREHIQILAELTKMRQVCCSPSLCYEGYDGGSGKVDLCMELEQLIDSFHGEYLYLSGKNTKEQRKVMVERFQQGEVPVFFISLKAGGTGMNLTAADTVDSKSMQ